jgi:hypothetical protein
VRGQFQENTELPPPRQENEMSVMSNLRTLVVQIPILKLSLRGNRSNLVF